MQKSMQFKMRSFLLKKAAQQPQQTPNPTPQQTPNPTPQQTPNPTPQQPSAAPQDMPDREIFPGLYYTGAKKAQYQARLARARQRQLKERARIQNLQRRYAQRQKANEVNYGTAGLSRKQLSAQRGKEVSEAQYRDYIRGMQLGHIKQRNLIGNTSFDQFAYGVRSNLRPTYEINKMHLQNLGSQFGLYDIRNQGQTLEQAKRRRAHQMHNLYVQTGTTGKYADIVKDVNGVSANTGALLAAYFGGKALVGKGATMWAARSAPKLLPSLTAGTKLGSIVRGATNFLNIATPLFYARDAMRTLDRATADSKLAYATDQQMQHFRKYNQKAAQGQTSNKVDADVRQDVANRWLGTEKAYTINEYAEDPSRRLKAPVTQDNVAQVYNRQRALDNPWSNAALQGAKIGVSTYTYGIPDILSMLSEQDDPYNQVLKSKAVALLKARQTGDISILQRAGLQEEDLPAVQHYIQQGMPGLRSRSALQDKNPGVIQDAIKNTAAQMYTSSVFNWIPWIGAKDIVRSNIEKRRQMLAQIQKQTDPIKKQLLRHELNNLMSGTSYVERAANNNGLIKSVVADMTENMSTEQLASHADRYRAFQDWRKSKGYRSESTAQQDATMFSTNQGAMIGVHNRMASNKATKNDISQFVIMARNGNAPVTLDPSLKQKVFDATMGRVGSLVGQDPLKNLPWAVGVGARYKGMDGVADFIENPAAFWGTTAGLVALPFMLPSLISNFLGNKTDQNQTQEAGPKQPTKFQTMLTDAQRMPATRNNQRV